jgi:hypothetical protein
MWFLIMSRSYFGERAEAGTDYPEQEHWEQEHEMWSWNYEQELLYRAASRNNLSSVCEYSMSRTSNWNSRAGARVKRHEQN